MVPKNSAEHSPSKGVRFTGGAPFQTQVNVAGERSNEIRSGVGLSALSARAQHAREEIYESVDSLVNAVVTLSRSPRTFSVQFSFREEAT